MRENSRRNKEFEGNSIKPELLVAMYEAVAAAQLVISGKFDEKIAEFKEEKQRLEEQLGLVKTLDDAKATASVICQEAEDFLGEVRVKMDALIAQEKILDDRQKSALVREQRVKQREDDVASAWTEHRRAVATFSIEKTTFLTESQTKKLELEKRESRVERREQEVAELDRKLKVKLDLLKAPIV